MKKSLIAAIVLTVTSGGLAVVGYIVDPVMTPVRTTIFVLLATGLGLVWGNVIWNARKRQHS